MVDIHKIDGKYYKEQEYSGLFRYILDIEKPKESDFDIILKLIMDEKNIPLEDAKRDLDKFIREGTDREGGSLSPWYHRWKKWFLDKTRFKDHELID